MILKILHVVLLASVKFFLILPYAMLIGLEFEQAVLAVLAGGIGGFLFFFYLSKTVLRAIEAAWPSIVRVVPRAVRTRYLRFVRKNKIKRKIKIFTRKNRFLIRFKNTYGFWGIIITTPPLLSIPLGAFLAGKYYAHRKRLVSYMILSIVCWTTILSVVLHLFPEIFFD